MELWLLECCSSIELASLLLLCLCSNCNSFVSGSVIIRFTLVKGCFCLGLEGPYR